MGWIYLIRNKVNNKCYVGQTIQKNVKNRWKAHICSKNTILSCAFARYGINNFEFSVITEVPDDQLDEREINEIRERNTISPNGYNLEEGGNLGKVVHQSSRVKMSEAKRGEKNYNFGRPRTEETKTKIGMAHKGLTHTDRTKAIISAKKRGTQLGENNSFFNKTHTPETKAKLGTAVDKYTTDGEFLETFTTVTFAAHSAGIDRKNVSACLIGRQKTAGGFAWKYSHPRLREISSV
jgi:group I intron endonuclease